MRKTAPSASASASHLSCQPLPLPLPLHFPVFPCRRHHLISSHLIASTSFGLKKFFDDVCGVPKLLVNLVDSSRYAHRCYVHRRITDYPLFGRRLIPRSHLYIMEQAKSGVKASSSSFAPTSHALRLMETLAASAQACEPVLLVRCVLSCLVLSAIFSLFSRWLELIFI